MKQIVKKKIECVIDRLKYLETKKCRIEMSKEQIDRSKKFATEMFRSLLIHRDKLNNKNICPIKDDIYT